MSETTALGAAFAAGLAVGVWKDTNELSKTWTLGQDYTSTMAAEKRDKVRCVGITTPPAPSPDPRTHAAPPPLECYPSSIHPLFDPTASSAQDMRSHHIMHLYRKMRLHVECVRVSLCMRHLHALTVPAAGYVSHVHIHGVVW